MAEYRSGGVDEGMALHLPHKIREHGELFVGKTAIDNNWAALYSGRR